MTITETLRQASVKAISSTFKSRRSQLRKQGSSKRSLHSQHSKKSLPDEDLSHTELDNSASSFFGEELMIVRNNPLITKVTLRDFIDRYERADLLALVDILRNSPRQWKHLKFDDVVEGTNYRRWQFRKEHLRRSIRNALAKEGHSEIPIVFQEHLNIDVDEMSEEALVSLLTALQKDRYMRSISIEGFLAHEAMGSIMGALVCLLNKGDRQWKSVVLRVSFEGDNATDYPKWELQTTLAKRQLKDISIKRGIPIGFHIC